MQDLIVNFGGGVDSTAMLVGLKDRGITPELIIFADTGGEKPETYEWVRFMDGWCDYQFGVGVTTVSRETTINMKASTNYTTLEGNCLENDTLPSLAFHRKSCSLKWKAEPMDAYIRGQYRSKRAKCPGLPWVHAIWDRGEKPVKAIGYDNGPKDSRRAHKRTEDDEFRYWYPLRDWGWDREECERQCHMEFGSVPKKSACFFCPATQECELKELAAEHPDLFNRALAMERNAKPKLDKIEGLWSRTTKRRPGNWNEWAAYNKLI